MCISDFMSVIIIAIIFIICSTIIFMINTKIIIAIGFLINEVFTSDLDSV
jgi:hypothetical protein